MCTPRNTNLLLAVILAFAALVLATPATAKMVSQKIDGNVCLTTGGGRFVDIPGFPGEQIDRRLLPDIKYLRRRYGIFVTDGLSTDPVHASNGEHPIGLGVDVVPDVAAGSTWNAITELALWAEPKQNHPIAPFRWVGYDGDEGHGRGNHLHLSWSHSGTTPGVPAASVYTLRCPTLRAMKSSSGDGAGSSGGTGAGTLGGASAGGGTGVGRLGSGLFLAMRDPVAETGGVGAP